MRETGKRIGLAAALIAGGCLRALAEDVPVDLRLPSPPEPLAPFSRAASFILPEPPPVVVDIPRASPAITTLRALALEPGLEPPQLPEPRDAAEAILNAPAASRRLLAAAPPATAEDRFGPAEALPDLPQPEDPNRLISLLRPRAAEVTGSAPATPPSATPALPASPASPRLAADALGLQLTTLARQQGLSEIVLRDALGFYEKRDFAPAWTEGGGLNAAARAILQTVSDAASHGLSSARFRRLEEALASARDAESREAAVSLLAIAYARDARGARINPLSVSKLITATPTLPEADDVLAALTQAGDAGAALEAYNPRHKGYAALRAKLAALAAPAQAEERPRLTFGPVITQGMSDPRVPLLRDLLGLPAGADAVMDRDLVNALRAWQREKGLRVTGRLDRATTASLGGVAEETASVRDPRVDIIANMERWRWLPVDLGESHIFVNVPDYALQLVRQGEVALSARVIVGKPQTPTPVFSDRMQFLVVNPAWNVPVSIAMKEYLPLLQKNPQALSARGLEVISRGRVIDPTTVDWSQGARNIAIRQPPGERNALGHIKFMFPNQHAVYLHDTPGRSLFANEKRAYSHGCVRVQDPFRLAEAIMGASWPERRLRAMVGGGERRIDLPDDLPVHLAYFTTFVDETGELRSREDLYGHNRRVKALLGL